jgi:hypothetical protein
MVLPVVVDTAAPPAMVLRAALLPVVPLLVVVATGLRLVARRRVVMVRRPALRRVDLARLRVGSVRNLAGPLAVR